MQIIGSEVASKAHGNRRSLNELGGLIFAGSHRGRAQKIADCLTSLDEVIAAQGRKWRP